MGNSYYYLDYDGKHLKTLKELKDWYLNKIKKNKKTDKDFFERVSHEDEIKYIEGILSDFVPEDNESEVFKNVLYRYVETFLKPKLIKFKPGLKTSVTPKKQKPTPGEDVIQKNYSYESWDEGRVAVTPQSLYLNVYFDYNNNNPNKRVPPNYKAINVTLTNDDLKKISAKRETLFSEDVKRTLDSVISDFVKRFVDSPERMRLINDEIETYAKFFSSEKPARNHEFPDADFHDGHRHFPTMSVSEIRQIFKENISTGKRDFSMIQSLRCRFFPPNDNRKTKYVEIYFKYWNWLKKYKKQYEIILALKEINPSAKSIAVNEFTLIEKLILDSKTNVNIYKLFKLERNLEDKDVISEREKYKDSKMLWGIPGEVDVYERVFKEELNRAKNSVYDHVLSFLDKPSKSAYLNQVFQQLVSMLEKNEKQRKLERSYNIVNNRDLQIHSKYMMELWQFLDDLKEDFKDYLDPDLVYNTDEKKFEHTILCRYHNRFEKISKSKTPEGLAYAVEDAEELFSELKKEYLERYDYIVQKWIEKNKVKGHNVSEKNFLHSQQKRLASLFSFDENNQTLTAIDHEQKTFVFSKEFYDKYMMEIYTFLKKHWQNQLNEIDALTIPDNSKAIEVRTILSPPEQTNAATFDTIISEQKQAYILKMLEHFNFTFNRQSIIKKGGYWKIRALVEVCTAKGFLPPWSLHPMCLIIASKINFPLQAVLKNDAIDYDDFCITLRNYIKANPLT